jgi:hypothetical protein
VLGDALVGLDDIAALIVDRRQRLLDPTMSSHPDSTAASTICG